MIKDTDIAIIGMACRFPGANTTAAFWENLAQGKESIQFFSDAELLAAGVDPALLDDPQYVKAGTTLSDVEQFDAALFGLAPQEAAALDPQHRILLECAWEALELAGYNTALYTGAIGVYVGTGMNRYLLNNLINHPESSRFVDHYQLMLSSEKDFLATRIAYKLNLTGPCITVQTACSTSLVAVHQACQSLLAGETDMALAGGVSIQIPQITGYHYQPGMIAAPDGHCRAFDAAAQGTVGGNGAGIVVLKGLADAIADGDTIHAVIKGSAVNNDGALKAGYTAPGVERQAAVIREAQAVAEVDSTSITYIEAHGTGTVLGDPIEVAALTEAFRTSKAGYCALGSVKTNIGHADTAAGVAGLIKTVLALQNRQIPASLHFTEPNPQIDFANSPFYVNTVLADWDAADSPRRAGVSSFGIGGTNAHVVLEEAPSCHPSGIARSWQLCVLSAKTANALEAVTEQLVNHIEHTSDNLADVAYTLAKGRRRQPYRRMLVCRTAIEASQDLRHMDRLLTNQEESQERPVVFLFPGQGAQPIQMAAELYQQEPVFQQAVDHCAALLKPTLQLDLRELLYPEVADTQAANTKLHQTEYAQPAVFVLSYALAKVWQAWGITPDAMLGHSIGEYVAATLAGVLTLADALNLVVFRGQLMQGLSPGSMLAVAQTRAELVLEEGLSLAAVNSPTQCVVAGPLDRIEAYQARLRAQRVAYRLLPNTRAFHSSMMEPILATFRTRVQMVDLQPPQIPYISNVTGTWVTPQDATNPDYWARHLCATVLFAEGLQVLLQEPQRVFLEVGPGHTLQTLVKQQTTQPVFAACAQPRYAQAEMASLLDTFGRLWVAGARIDWDGFYAEQQRQRIPLPTYPFERQRYWLEPSTCSLDPTCQVQRRPLHEWFYVPSWEYKPLPSSPLPAPSHWLLLLDEVGLGQRLAETLRQTQRSVVTVSQGQHFSQDTADHFVMDWENPQHYAKLWSALVYQPNKIVHLLNVGTIEEATLQNSFYSVCYLAQALGKQQLTEVVDLIVIANQLYDVTGTDVIQPLKAAVLGPTHVLPCEYANLRCRAIDVAWPVAEFDAALVTALHQECAMDIQPTACGASSIAYRGLRRWQSQLAPTVLPETTVPLRTGGTYLITGGLGGIGLQLAETLAAWKTNLVLWGRTVLPEPAVWAEWLAEHTAEDTISQQIRCLQKIQAAGGTILTQALDVTDLNAMQAALAVATTEFGPIQGVVHAAGIAGDSLVQKADPEALAAVLAPKITGTHHLHHCLQAMPLDFWVLCSSRNVVLGGVGQIAYTAANAFQDAFAQKHRTTTYPILSINWDRWCEVGMAASQFAVSDKLEGLSPAEGGEVFCRLLGHPLPQVLISIDDLTQWSSDLRHQKPSEGIQLPQVQHPRPDIGIAYTPLQNPLEHWLAAIWQTHLGIEQIGRDDDFFQHLAGDSLSAMRLINQIQEKLGAIVHLQAVFDAPTIGKMAAYLLEHYADDVQRHADLMAVVQSKVTDQTFLTTEMVAQKQQTLLAGFPPFATAQKKLASAIFILSPPRVGSTLLRVMLAGHPQLFSPPELGLLTVNTLQDRTVEKNQQAVNIRWSGLIRAVMQAYDLNPAAAQQKVGQLYDQAVPIEQIYADLQANLSHQRLVDKSPIYSYDLKVLQRAEQSFDNALYVHLLRHPYGMIRSYMEAKLDLVGASTARLSMHNLSLRQSAEATWLICNQNIRDFLQDIPAHRQCQVRFEDLVTTPQIVLESLSHFLNIQFDPAMLEPHQNKTQRMTDAVHAEGRMIGDPKFHQHTQVKADVATQWKQAYSTDFLSPITATLADYYGYTERIQSAPILLNSQNIIQDPDLSLQQLEQLSEADIDAALTELIQQ